MSGTKNVFRFLLIAGVSFGLYQLFYRYVPDKHQSITYFCVSDQTVKKWSKQFIDNDNDKNYLVNLNQNKNIEDGSKKIFFDSNNFLKIQKIRNKNKTTTLVLEENNNQRVFFYMYSNKVYAGTDNQCINDTDIVNKVKY